MTAVTSFPVTWGRSDHQSATPCALIQEACGWLERHSTMNPKYVDALLCTVQWILDNPKFTRENRRKRSRSSSERIQNSRREHTSGKDPKWRRIDTALHNLRQVQEWRIPRSENNNSEGSKTRRESSETIQSGHVRATLAYHLSRGPLKTGLALRVSPRSCSSLQRLVSTNEEDHVGTYGEHRRRAPANFDHHQQPESPPAIDIATKCFDHHQQTSVATSNQNATSNQACRCWLKRRS